VSGAPKVILGVAASDSHVVANHLIAFQLRQLGYEVLNLGACTPVSEFVDCASENPDALAIVIGSINGHAVEDLAPLRAVRAQGVLSCPVIVGGNLSVGSEKSGREGEALLALGVDHVLSDIDELTALLDGLRTQAETGGRAAERAVPRPSQLEVAA
jgi:methylaspartate mutase sigma subunit